MDEAFSPGSRVDRYTIVRHVATGGMGSVWEAQLDGKHGFAKRVAVKTIRAEHAADPRFRQMFLEEARVSSRLSHANVAQVLDVGEAGGSVYIVFEWVDGRSLESTCVDAAARGESVSLEQALRVAADVCAGLHAVHELRSDDGDPLNVVHRDVSPANVLVSPEGFAKVIDFGLAKAKDRAIEATKSGIVKGTPQFMAPEQAMGRALDRRADVFSVGAVLFRVLAGRPPFADRDALAQFVLDGVLPPMPDAVPEAVRAVVAKAMRRDPRERFATAAEMRRAIERAMHAEPSVAVDPGAPGMEPVALTTLAEGAARLALEPTEPATPERSPAPESLAATHRRRSATRWWVLALAVVGGLVVLSFVLALRS